MESSKILVIGPWHDRLSQLLRVLDCLHGQNVLLCTFCYFDGKSDISWDTNLHFTIQATILKCLVVVAACSHTMHIVIDHSRYYHVTLLSDEGIV